VWDNFNVHLRAFTGPGLAAGVPAARLCPDLNPVEGIWSVFKRGVLANLAVASYAYLVQVIQQSGNLAVSGAVLAHRCLTTRRALPGRVVKGVWLRGAVVGQTAGPLTQPGLTVRRLHGVSRCACAAVLSVLVVLAGCASATKTAPAGRPPQTAAAVSTAAAGHSPASVASAASTPTSTGAAKLSLVFSVSCVDARHCWAGAEAGTKANDGVILATVNGGAAWTVQKTIPGVDAVGPIDCPSATRCLAAGDRVASLESALLVSTTNGGKTWAEHALPKSLSELQALDCVNDEDCWGVGIRFPAGSGIVMATTNFGRSWVVQNQASIFVSMGVSYGISCPGLADCVIVGVGALTTDNGGATWTRRSLRAAGELNAVACPSLSRCVAEGDVTSADPENTSTGIATSDGGQSWDLRVAKVGSRVGDLNSLSCPTPATCLSVGFGWTRLAASAPSPPYMFWGAVERSFDGGRTWTGVTEPEASNLFGVSCATGTPDCIAVGQFEETTGVILRTVDDGSTWTEIPLPEL
jgi:hypothetical protein